MYDQLSRLSKLPSGSFSKILAVVLKMYGVTSLTWAYQFPNRCSRRTRYSGPEMKLLHSSCLALGAEGPPLISSLDNLPTFQGHNLNNEYDASISAEIIKL